MKTLSIVLFYNTLPLWTLLVIGKGWGGVDQSINSDSLISFFLLVVSRFFCLNSNTKLSYSVICCVELLTIIVFIGQGECSVLSVGKETTRHKRSC